MRSGSRPSKESKRSGSSVAGRRVIWAFVAASLTVVFGISVRGTVTADRRVAEKASLLAAATTGTENTQVSSYLQMLSSRNGGDDLERMKASREAQELYLRTISSMMNQAGSTGGNNSSLSVLLQQLRASAASQGSLSPAVSTTVNQVLSSMRNQQQTSSLSTQDYLKAINQIMSSIRSQESLPSSAAVSRSSVSSVKSVPSSTPSSQSSIRSSAPSSATQTSSSVSSIVVVPVVSPSSTVSSSLTADQERELLIHLLELMLQASESTSSSALSSSVPSSASSSLQGSSYEEYVLWMKNIGEQTGVRWTAAETGQVAAILTNMSSVQAGLARKLTSSLTLLEPAAHHILGYVLRELPLTPLAPATAEKVFAGFKQENGRLLMARGFVSNPDIDPRDWYAPAVVYAQKKGLMKGQADGLFAPEKTLNQAELAVILANAMGRPATHGAAPVSGSFNAWPSWGKEAVASLRAQGVNVLFFTASPASPVTRLQVARAISETLLLGRKADAAHVLSFTDTQRLPPDLNRYVSLVSSLGIMTGKAGGTLFDPYGLLNRAEAAKIFGKAVDVRAAQTVAK